MRISDWSSDVCSSDLEGVEAAARDISGRASAVHILINNAGIFTAGNVEDVKADQWDRELGLNLRAPFFLVQALLPKLKAASRSEEHTSELQSLMRISYAVFCLKKKTKHNKTKKV